MIYLVHHADAVDSDVDPQRPLSAGGRAQAVELARRAAERGVRPAAIWHSGKLRARQTADAFRAECNPSAEFAAIRGLQPTDPPEWIHERLIGEAREVMLVGHFPSLPRIRQLLVTGGVDGPAHAFPLHGLVQLDAVGDRWVIRWESEGQ
ncbi:MAG: histidine phosphatase family protein [Vicinamibacterales bacterium]